MPVVRIAKWLNRRTFPVPCPMGGWEWAITRGPAKAEQAADARRRSPGDEGERTTPTRTTYRHWYSPGRATPPQRRKVRSCEPSSRHV
jgi:hypothetical protein